MVTATQFVEAARSYLGAPYRWWTGAFPEYGPPGYMDWQKPGYYDPSFVMSEGVHCAGYVNIVRMACGLEPVGLTKAYEDWAWANGGVAFDSDAPGKAGAICVKGWQPGTAPGVAEGHIAIYTTEHDLIHASPGFGVHESGTDIDTYWWAQYAVYLEMPDLDYSGGTDNATDTTPPRGAPGRAPGTPWQWLAIDAEGWARFDGPDYSRGWFDTQWQWHEPDDAGY